MHFFLSEGRYWLYPVHYLSLLLLFSPAGFYLSKFFFKKLSIKERLMLAPTIGLTVICLFWALWGVFGLPITFSCLLSLLIIMTSISWWLSRLQAKKEPGLELSQFTQEKFFDLKTIIFLLLLVLTHFQAFYYTASTWAPSDVDCMTNAFQASQIKIHGTYPFIPAPEWGASAQVQIVYPPVNIIFSAFVSSLLSINTAQVYLLNSSFFLLLLPCVLWVLARRFLGYSNWACAFVPLVALPRGVFSSYIDGGDNLEIQALLTSILCFLWWLEFIEKSAFKKSIYGALLMSCLYLISPLFFCWIGYGVIAYAFILLIRKQKKAIPETFALFLVLAISVVIVLPWLLMLPGSWVPGSRHIWFWELFWPFEKNEPFAVASIFYLGLGLLGIVQTFRISKNAGTFLLGTFLLWIFLIHTWLFQDDIGKFLFEKIGLPKKTTDTLLGNWLLFRLSFSILLPILAIFGLGFIVHLFKNKKKLGFLVILIVSSFIFTFEWRKRTGAPLLNYCDYKALTWFGDTYKDKNVMLVNLSNAPSYVANWAPVITEMPCLCRRVQFDMIRKSSEADIYSLQETVITAPNFEALKKLMPPKKKPEAKNYKNTALYYQDRLHCTLKAIYLIDTQGGINKIRDLGFTHIYVPSGIPSQDYRQSSAYLKKCLNAVEKGNLKVIYSKSNLDIEEETGRVLSIWPGYEKKAWLFEIVQAK